MRYGTRWREESRMQGETNELVDARVQFSHVARQYLRTPNMADFMLSSRAAITMFELYVHVPENSGWHSSGLWQGFLNWVQHTPFFSTKKAPSCLLHLQWPWPRHTTSCQPVLHWPWMQTVLPQLTTFHQVMMLSTVSSCHHQVMCSAIQILPDTHIVSTCYSDAFEECGLTLSLPRGQSSQNQPVLLSSLSASHPCLQQGHLRLMGMVPLWDWISTLESALGLSKRLHSLWALRNQTKNTTLVSTQFLRYIPRA